MRYQQRSPIKCVDVRRRHSSLTSLYSNSTPPPAKGERVIRVTQRGCTDTAGVFFSRCRDTPPAPNIGGERALSRRIGSILKGGEGAAHRATVRPVACLPPRCCRGPVREVSFVFRISFVLVEIFPTRSNRESRRITLDLDSRNVRLHCLL